MAVGDEDAERRQSRRSSAKSTGGSPAKRVSSDSAKPARSGESPDPGRLSALKAMRAAAGQLEELLGRAPDSVSAIKHTDDGWLADVEVVDVERVPETTSVMASYRVTLDDDGELVAYEQVRRYNRGQTDRRA